MPENTSEFEAKPQVKQAHSLMLLKGKGSLMLPSKSRHARGLQGQFRGAGEVKRLDCLTRFGRDVKIIFGPAKRSSTVDHVVVVLAG